MSFVLSRQGGLRRSSWLACLCACLVVGPAWAAGPATLDAGTARDAPRSVDGLWERVPESAMPWRDPGVARPRAYDTTRLDLARLQSVLATAPVEDTPWADVRGGVELSLPLPGGRFGRFRIVNAPILDPETASRFPEISTYRGRGIDDPGASVRLDLGTAGMNAYVRDLGGVAAIRPYAAGDRSHYQSYFLRDDPAEAADASCGAAAEDPWHTPLDALAATARTAPAAVQQSIRRTYRIAIGATQEYTAQNGGTVASALAAIVTRLQGVNLVFNAEIGVQLNLVSPALIGTTEPDGYTSGNINSLIAENQAITDLLIGPANYDLGQVFDAAAPGGGASGRARLASVCRNNEKASGTSGGNSIGLLAHELGHMFAASHTFNNNAAGSCASFNGANQREAATAFEPGSGSTLMSYGGTCAPADLQLSRDLYFHGQSLDQMVLYISSGDGAGCAAISNTGNGGITITDWTPTVTVPDRTPFRLSLRATDADFDPVTVVWEEVDAGAASPPELDNGDRALFRSYPPSQVQWRSFPRLDYVLNNAGTPPGTYTCAAGPPAVTCLTGEALTTTTRTLKIRAHARDGFDALNSVQVAVNVVGGSGPFAVGSPNAASDVWVQGTGQFVSWLPGASADPPIGVDTVRITLSTDGGLSFPIVLADAVPNTGIAPVYVPDDALTTQARVKVESVIPGNFHGFYDISNANFQIRGLAVTNLADSGEGSLRKAILDANSDPRPTTIRFAIGASGTVQVIEPTTPLPAITAPVELDGWSQGGTGYEGPPLIELRGNLIGTPNADGLVVTGGGSTIRGLSVHRFSGSGIVLRGGGGNVVEFSVIGANAGGSSTEGNGGNGIWIDNSPNNQIGRRSVTSAFRPNVIQRNEVGVLISGAASSGNGLYYNLIGTRGFGIPGYGNRSAGVRIVDAPGNFVGGTRQAGGLFLSAGNTISGQSSGGGTGVHITGPLAAGNEVRSNLIGLTPDGTTGLRNGFAGVQVQNAPGTRIGGVDPAEGNALACSDYVVHVSGAAAATTRIEGNTIGTNQAGNASVGCSVYGVYTEVPILIGGADPAARNWISGNGSIGVFLSEAGASGSVVQGNYIGTNVNGTAAVPNSSYGIFSQRAGGHLIGGSQPGQGNLISGNLGSGIDLAGATSGTRIEGNYIGTNAAGTAAIPNQAGVGVRIFGGSDNVVGGTASGARNLISGNGPPGNGHGIRLEVFGSSSGNRIEGNYIGTDVTGLLPLGNGGGGIQVFSPDSSVGVGVNTIGGTTAAARNVIAGNAGNGIWLASADRFRIVGNYIGVGSDGTTPLGNGLDGVTIYGNRNQVGEAGAGNTIAYSGVGTVPASIAGVRIDSGEGNSVRGNSTYANNALGHNLMGGVETLGVTANDSCDADAGPNRLQNFPVLLAVSSQGAGTSASGTLNAAPNQVFQIDVYAGPDCDASGNGEGRLHLGSFTAATGADCNASFSATLPLPLPPSQVATATATDAQGNTSEYSACTAVVGGDLILANGFE